MTQAIKSMETFEHAHMEAKKALDRYFWMPRSNYQKLDPCTLRQLELPSKLYMHANNPYSRIECVGRLVEAMKPVIETITDTKPAHLVTFVLDTFAVPYDPDIGFDVDMVTAFAREALKGFHSIGMAEAALYTALPRECGRFTRVISWHTHSLVWGADVKLLNESLDAVNAAYKSLIPTFSAAHCMPVGRKRAEGLLYYISKAPMKEYRASSRKPGKAWSTGDDPAGMTIKQWKQDLRVGDRVRMCKVLKDICLDDLLFATGAGVPIRDRVVALLLAEFERRQLRR